MWTTAGCKPTPLFFVAHAAGHFAFDPPLEIGIEEALQIAVEDVVEVMFQVAGAAVLDALRGMEEVVANLGAEADLSPVLVFDRVLGFAFLVFQADEAGE